MSDCNLFLRNTGWRRRQEEGHPFPEGKLPEPTRHSDAPRGGRRSGEAGSGSFPSGNGCPSS